MEKPVMPLGNLSSAEKEELNQQMTVSWERDKFVKEVNMKGRRQVASWRDDQMNVE